MEPRTPSSVNPLSLIHRQLTRLPQAVRDCICKECDWSLPTYYRKVKGDPISNAEKEKIVAVLFERLAITWQLCKQH
jgi:hypothetical protein